MKTSVPSPAPEIIIFNFKRMALVPTAHLISPHAILNLLSSSPSIHVPLNLEILGGGGSFSMFPVRTQSWHYLEVGFSTGGRFNFHAEIYTTMNSRETKSFLILWKQKHKELGIKRNGVIPR